MGTPCPVRTARRQLVLCPISGPSSTARRFPETVAQPCVAATTVHTAREPGRGPSTETPAGALDVKVVQGEPLTLLAPQG